MSTSKICFPSEPIPIAPKPQPLKPGERKNYLNQPKGSLWFIHDPHIFHDPETMNYYVYSTGAICHRSSDLIHWDMVGKVVDQPPKESIEWVGDNGIWAPDIVKVDNEYRLYCSNSTWGVRQSCIFLATSDKAEGPFNPKGCVLKTSHQSSVNAIDANIIEDNNTGEQYMVYGSFWGGCYILKLDKESGFAAEEGIGTCIARRPEWTDRSIEGPYIKYNPDTGYYYLFVSYGSLKSDYNIRVGRSRQITGPYIDHNGRDMTDLKDDNNTIGLMIACGYHWNDGIGYMGPGHNSVLRDFDNEWYLAYHIRQQNFKNENELSMMQIRKIFWTSDGWPVVSPQLYAGEKTQPIDKSNLVGQYEIIKLIPTIPQGVLNSVPMSLHKDGSMTCCSINGTWKMIDDTTLTITYGNTVETYIITPIWDYELWNPSIALTGKDQDNTCIWAKKIISPL